MDKHYLYLEQNLVTPALASHVETKRRRVAAALAEAQKPMTSRLKLGCFCIFTPHEKPKFL